MKGLLTKDRLVGIITVIVVVSFSFLAQAAGENKVGTEQLLEDWAKYWSSPNDIERLLSLFTDDCVYEDVTFGAVNHGKEELRTFAKGVFAAFPDFKIKNTASFVAGNWAGIEWVFTGTHKGDLPGMPATNKSVSIRGATILELQEGKIKRNSDYWDLATFMKQTGLMPSGTQTGNTTSGGAATSSQQQ